MTALPVTGERKRGARCCEPIGPTRLDAATAAQLSDDLQALAHPIRLQILDILLAREGQVCVCDLDGALPVKQPTVSHHLRLLRDAGLVTATRDGVWAYYAVERDALAALRQRISQRLAALA